MAIRPFTYIYVYDAVRRIDAIERDRNTKSWLGSCTDFDRAYHDQESDDSLAPDRRQQHGVGDCFAQSDTPKIIIMTGVYDVMGVVV
jgi:hypothetical protein